MYLHLGRDYVLNTRDIIGIFSLETTTVSPRGRAFLDYAQKNGAVVSCPTSCPRVMCWPTARWIPCICRSCPAPLCAAAPSSCCPKGRCPGRGKTGRPDCNDRIHAIG